MADERFVYVVTGSAGEYSDHRSWEVRAFNDEAKAKALAARLNAWCKERGLDAGSGNEEYQDAPWDKKPKPEEDPNISADYTGTAYGVMKIPLEA